MPDPPNVPANSNEHSLKQPQITHNDHNNVQDSSAATTSLASQIQGYASSGFAFPSSNPFSDTLGPSTPFGFERSPSLTPEETPLGTPTAELQKLSLGVERYARAIEDPGLIGSFSGTVPLPTLSQTHHTAARRRPSNMAMESIAGGDTGLNNSDPSNMNRRKSAVADGVSGHGVTLASIRRAFTGRLHPQDDGMIDLESNIKHTIEDTNKCPEVVVSQMEVVSHSEKIDPIEDLEVLNLGEGLRRRKPKGGVLSQLLKLQRNEATAAAAAVERSSSLRLHPPSSAKRPAVKRVKKAFYYRSSRNNSATSLKVAAPLSAATTPMDSPRVSPKISPRNSMVLDNEKLKQDREDNAAAAAAAILKKDVDNRTIHHDIAEILTRQSFLIMMTKALILYGAPSHRIEETCVLLARKMEVDASFSLLPGLMTVSFSDPETHTSDTRHLKCSQGMDMSRLAEVHRIALAVLRGESIEKANRELEQVTLEPPIYPLWLTLLGWLGSSACVAPLAFGGGWYDMVVAGFCGLMVGILGIVAGKFPVYGNVFEMTSSILVGFVAKAFGDRVCFSAVALAGVVVLLPGLLLTQAIMELSSRNIVSGAVRMFYALMYAFFLGFGLALGAEAWDHISGGPTTASPTACQHPISRWWYFLIYPAVSVCINITFNANLRQWFGMTFVTAVGLVLTLFLQTGPQITAAIAAFAVGITGKVYGRLTGQLSYVPLLSGVLLLVPGSVGVRGILAIIESDPSQGFTFVLTMIHVSVAITLGIFCSALVCYPFWRKSTFMNF